jgi:uncharacterized protein with NAD-binding domain and iron-sulfur cluster
MSEQDRIKVAIIGGGCASVAAAFELTRPEHAGKYQVTIYQLGWRLGGKGASGRGVNDRIEEHGLHLWMGFYENAFRLVRECYAELDRDPESCPIADWRDAFLPAPLIGVGEQLPDGQWLVWKAALPPVEGSPGDSCQNGQRWTIADYMGRAVALLRTLFATLRGSDGGGSGGTAEHDTAGAGGPGAQSANVVLDGISRLLQYGELATVTGLVQAVGLLQVVVGSLSLYPESIILRLLDAISSNARGILEAQLEHDVAVRRVWQVIDLTLATLRGGIRFGLMTDPRGFDAIDEYDCREWLRLNGASDSSLNSGYLRALYDLGFSYQNGDVTRPRIAAGQAVRSMVRAFFTYRGSFFWRMCAGMGDVVFAPFYEVLKRRGARFEFFHRLENVKLVDRAGLKDGESAYVEALEFDVQAEIKGGGEYQPLINVRGLPCWPAKPDYTQLVDGEQLERERWDFESHWDCRKRCTKILRVIDDFDLVVLGVSLGAIPYVCKEIIAHDPRWRAMVDHVKTVATQAFQIWMSADMKALGWVDPPITLCGFAEPFDTWADMRNLIPHEGWSHPPRALAYFCNVLADLDAPDDRAHQEYPVKQREQVRQNAIRFLNHDIGHLWPNAVRAPGEFRWDLLVDPNEPHEARTAPGAEARFASQYWTANVNPSDRYALSLPGSSAYRISPLDRTYDNLTIAGDWTACGFNAGCVEAAVMSGRLAAHAISRSPRLEGIVGFDHP